MISGPFRDRRLSRRDFVAGAGAAGWAVGMTLAGCGPGPNGPETKTPTCGEYTPTNIEGPFYTPSSPERGSLVAAETPGTRLRIEGTVYASSCEVLPGAWIDFWHADHEGAYDNVGFNLRGHQFTDQAGRFRLETIVPGRYLNGATYRPAHIHVKVGGVLGAAMLTTQLYFADDPFNADDPWIEDGLIMAVADDGSGGQQALFDFVLPRT